jgi:predicted CXXCH cytochrome family protein
VSADPPRRGRRSSRSVLAFLVIAAVSLLPIVWLAMLRPPAPHTNTAASNSAPIPTTPVTAPEYVGSEACRECHAGEYDAWRGSQHQRAMQHAGPDTVLGAFNDSTFTYAGIESRFYTRDGHYFVRTDGPDGAPTDFEIAYTFGVDPLQQYLVAFPDGRLQALSIAWDTRARSQGGQRWFHLHPAEKITHEDELHWTKRQQNWNFMCADCHSTNVHKNYDATADTFASTWSEISIGCEACHGPGSAHVAAARAPGGGVRQNNSALTVRFDARRGASWTIDPVSGNAKRSVPKPDDGEINVCAQCHSRRSQIAEDYRPGEPFLDHYLPALIEPPLYWIDGQQRDEVYVWGSFLESRMYARGVTCSDCHEPHTQQLRASGNAVCAQCHRASKYDGPQHHFHAAGTPGAQCVSCHMPATTYMVIDPRRDHSLRIPRPDETMAYGVPNACNRCHTDRSAQWADARLRKWYGHSPHGFQQFAGALYSDEQGRASAAANLAALVEDRSQPGLVRGTAAHALSRHPDPVIEPVVARSLKDPEPLVRRGALDALELYPPGARLQIGGPLLDDPVRTVRIEAAYALAGTPQSAMTPAQRRSFARAAAEFRAVQHYNADRPEARMLEAGFDFRTGDLAAAESEFKEVIERDADYVPAYVNLADLYRTTGREADAEAVLEAGLEHVPGTAALHHALGLTLVRSQQLDRALPELARAAQLDPADTRYAYVYAVALHSSGLVNDALDVIAHALEREPENRDLLVAAITFSRDAGHLDVALRYARQFASAYPQDRSAQQLRSELEAAVH